MADGRRERRAAPRRALIGPLVMLVGGAAVTAAVWRFLMIDPGVTPVQVGVPEHLSAADRGALDRVLADATR